MQSKTFISTTEDDDDEKLFRQAQSWARENNLKIVGHNAYSKSESHSRSDGEYITETYRCLTVHAINNIH